MSILKEFLESKRAVADFERAIIKRSPTAEYGKSEIERAYNQNLNIEECFLFQHTDIGSEFWDNLAGEFRAVKSKASNRMENVTVKIRGCYLSVNIQDGNVLSVSTDDTECIDNLIFDNELLKRDIAEKAMSEVENGQ